MPTSLRIGMLASNVIRIPPTPPERYVPQGGSGAPELIVHHLTEELVKRGHEVTLFASGDSQTKAKLVSVTDEATWKKIGYGPHREYENMLISRAYHMAQQNAFDLIHTHLDMEAVYFAPLVSIPTITTLHAPLDGLRKDVFQEFKTTQHYVSISDNQRLPLPDLNYAGTVYNGIEIDKIPFSAQKDDYLIFAGRIIDNKGVAEAITVAKKTNNRLLIFGSAEMTGEYWLNTIQPLIDDDQIVYKGMVPRQELFKFYSRAKAFIFPLKWEEPFGLAPVEAMATGTPTIAFSRGSMPEVIENGITGFVVNTIEEMIDAVAHTYTITPHACRQWVTERFSIEKMTDSYEKLYFSILKKA